jgi:phosphonate transport system substrate-binding protein
VLASRRRSASYEPICAPVLLGERYRDRPIYFSDVIVRRGLDAASFADLRGASFAYNEPSSHSGYGVVRHKLVTMGETGGFFGRVVPTGAHMHSIAQVVAGTVDASAIDSHVLALEVRDDPALSEHFRIIDALGPSTIQPVVAAAHVTARIREAVRGAFLRMAEDPRAAAFLERGLVRRFVRVGGSSYDDIRQMVRECEEARFLVLK